ncbi:MAG TPA: hypothetical protein ENN29_05555 [Candidatus Hydrogenedentes bacterium]|nr:hypothetical protein [Candidatus Hydrogenedentota bacterium]
MYLLLLPLPVAGVIYAVARALNLITRHSPLVKALNSLDYSHVALVSLAALPLAPEPLQSETTAADKAADLYRQACEMMLARQRQEWVLHGRRINIVPRLLFDNRYGESYASLDTGVLWLPVPSQQTPEDQRLRLQEIVEEYRPILQVLYEAATYVNSKDIIVLPSDEIYHSREGYSLFYKGLQNMPRLLLLASLSAAIEGNEAEVVQALESLKAFCEVQFINPWGHATFFRSFHAYADNIRRSMAFGIERNTFSRPTLDVLDDLLDYKATVTREDLVAHMQGGLQSQSSRIRMHLEYKAVRQEKERNSRLFPMLGDGLVWYRDRFVMLNGTGELAMSRHMQHYLLSGDTLRQPEERREYFQYRRYRYYLLVDDLYDRVEPMDFGYLDDAYNLTRFRFQGEERLGVLRIALAAERYRRDKGEFPENVTDMTPAYLTQEIITKFHENKYVYERTETGWVIKAQIYKSSDAYFTMLAHPLGDIRWRNYY